MMGKRFGFPEKEVGSDQSDRKTYWGPTKLGDRNQAKLLSTLIVLYFWPIFHYTQVHHSMLIKQKSLLSHMTNRKMMDLSHHYIYHTQESLEEQPFSRS